MSKSKKRPKLAVVNQLPERKEESETMSDFDFIMSLLCYGSQNCSGDRLSVDGLIFMEIDNLSDAQLAMLNNFKRQVLLDLKAGIAEIRPVGH